MDTLIIACIVLTLTNISFAVLAELRRRELVRKDSRLLRLACQVSQARREGYDDGLTSGLRRGYGEMYLAVVKAERDGNDPVAAAGRVGRMNAEFLLGQPEEQLTRNEVSVP